MSLAAKLFVKFGFVMVITTKWALNVEFAVGSTHTTKNHQMTKNDFSLIDTLSLSTMEFLGANFVRLFNLPARKFGVRS